MFNFGLLAHHEITANPKVTISIANNVSDIYLIARLFTN